jgi:hypothetical protein
MGTKNVLIIDGNEAMQKLRARLLRSRGADEVIARDKVPEIPTRQWLRTSPVA